MKWVWIPGLPPFTKNLKDGVPHLDRSSVRRSASLRAGLRRKEGILPLTVPSIYEPAQAQAPALAQHAGLLSAAPGRGWFLAGLDVMHFHLLFGGSQAHRRLRTGVRRFIRRSANSIKILK